MHAAYAIKPMMLAGTILALSTTAWTQENQKTKHGRLGDTPQRLAEYYGKPTQVVEDPDFKDAKRYTFNTDSLTVTAVVVAEKCGKITYAVKGAAKLSTELAEELLEANAVPGVRWQKLEVGGMPKWFARGQAADGSRVLRLAVRHGPPLEELQVEDVLSMEKYEKKK